ncbi:hypothetical protein JVT61DRAFT_9359 [Boletus reticuloceps]|uniref:Copper acquisition factor BIM1-like domain-containing protein n=1 Tax=Boletus reticuloceps TaxID=495285 RepID=A0A8I3A6N2_9AGAM|nr:hypothetical protein JVT61DRAFT_9359 [Boletus reticuloceps]
MRLISVALTAAFATFANAHFQLQFPLPRGPFVQNSEPTFCDGYTNAVSNRTVFPLSNGVIDLDSEHPTWTVGVIISTVQNPTSFSDFNSSLVVPYFKTSGEGGFCFPINIAASNVSGIQDGANVTIQVIFDGGDGILYQCADLTLSANVTVPSNATSSCATVTASTAASSPTATASSSAAGKNMLTVPSVVAVLLTGLALLL